MYIECIDLRNYSLVLAVYLLVYLMRQYIYEYE